MTDNGEHSLTVGHGGFVYWQGCRLPMRYKAGALEFVVKNPRDRARLKCKRVEIPLSDIAGLERARAESVPRAEKSKKPPPSALGGATFDKSG